MAKLDSRGNANLGDLLIQMKITNRLLAAQLRAQMKQQELVQLLMSTDARTGKSRKS